MLKGIIYGICEEKVLQKTEAKGQLVIEHSERAVRVAAAWRCSCRRGQGGDEEVVVKVVVVGGLFADLFFFWAAKKERPSVRSFRSFRSFPQRTSSLLPNRAPTGLTGPGRRRL